MTDVWIDPAELDTMCTTIAQQAQRAQDAFAGDLGLRDVDLPAHLDWIRDEGAALAQEAAVVTVAYLLNGVDLGVRAEAVRVEQGTSTAVTTPTEVQQEGFLLSGTPTLTGSPGEYAGFLLTSGTTVVPGNLTGGPLVGGFVLDQMIGPDGQVRTGSGSINPVALARLAAGGGAGALLPDFAGDLAQDINGPLLAGRNETYDPATNTTKFDPDKFYANKAAEEKAIERSRRRE